MNQCHLFMSLIFICINNFNMPLLKVAPKISKINTVILVYIDLIVINILYILKECTLQKGNTFLFILIIHLCNILYIYIYAIKISSRK